MTKPKVLISDKMDPNAERILKERGCDVDVITGKTPEELKAIIGQYDGLAIRSATKVTKEILDAATNLKVIGRAGIGVDNVDIPTASAKGVVVMNTPFGNSITTAEHAIALLMALARQIPEANTRTQAGEWPKNGFMGVEVTGKTLGLIGAGNIGSIVASRALGLRMKVVAYDPFLTEERAVEMGVEKVDLETPRHPGRLHHAAHPADRRDAQHPQPRPAREDQEGRAHRQLRARRADRRGGAEGRARLRPHRRRRARRVCRGAGQGKPAVRHAELHLHAAPRRLDQRSAGQRRAAGGRADRRLPRQRRGDQRAQRAFAAAPRKRPSSSRTWRWPKSSAAWSASWRTAT